MLGKLLKYEFKATGRLFLPLFGALMIVAIVTRIFIRLNFEVPQVIGITLAVIMIIGIFVITLIVTLQRFYKNLLTNEGYLMFTLPVSSDQLIWSKLIVAGFWNIVSILVAFLAIVVMAITDFNLAAALEEFRALLGTAGIVNPQLTLYVLEFIVLCLASLASSILMLYTCMAASLFFNKHRVLAAFGAYIALYTFGQILAGVVFSVASVTNLPQSFINMTLNSQIQTGFFVVLAGTVVTGVAFYVFTRLMLKYKLNLE